MIVTDQCCDVGNGVYFCGMSIRPLGEFFTMYCDPGLFVTFRNPMENECVCIHTHSPIPRDVELNKVVPWTMVAMCRQFMVSCYRLGSDVVKFNVKPH